jgi:putative endonuclease
MYYVYIVTNKNNAVLYIGVAGFLEGRMHDHRERLIEGFTKRYQVTKLIYYEDYPDPTSAIQREKQLKGWRREKKIALIRKMNPRWVDLFEQMIEGMDLTLLHGPKRDE